ncbi:hypothetical protein BU26DRAFT_569374 [Trematosphaeria pertusa]|uniref:Uncharacterized protein n=1 Tax=Trematosphaeria pertusa TaxID=390896 RepID=A0A6A6I230_9PLEO|nr:uncharacterized protein BU26DRAFT_569374 [Trematosphaeria pertusa]KAF2244391.1 hypothetical protein BU26DRAFT_569374 [Trematosphaeria pertusa]
MTLPQPGYVRPASVALPKPRKRTLTGLLVLAFFIPPLALYLDGASGICVIVNLVVWGIIFFPAGIIHAFVYLLRSQERRNMSRPMRYRLWARSAEGTRPLEEAPKSPALLFEREESRALTAHPSYASPTGPEDNPFKDPIA